MKVRRDIRYLLFFHQMIDLEKLYKSGLELKVELFMMLQISLHKLADVIFGITQTRPYIMSSALVR